jgi:hypothetical protein
MHSLVFPPPPCHPSSLRSSKQSRSHCKVQPPVPKRLRTQPAQYFKMESCHESWEWSHYQGPHGGTVFSFLFLERVSCAPWPGLPCSSHSLPLFTSCPLSREGTLRTQAAPLASARLSAWPSSSTLPPQHFVPRFGLLFSFLQSKALCISEDEICCEYHALPTGRMDKVYIYFEFLIIMAIKFFAINLVQLFYIFNSFRVISTLLLLF